jgi:hypothetical protein
MSIGVLGDNVAIVVPHLFEVEAGIRGIDLISNLHHRKYSSQKVTLRSQQFNSSKSMGWRELMSLE